MIPAASIFAAATILVLTATGATGQQPLELRDGDRVIFMGDSITQFGEYPLLLECYLLQRHPTLKLTFRNAAWNSDRAWLHERTADTKLSGDAMLKMSPDDPEQEKLRSQMVTHGLARDILPLKPTLVTVMYGACDVRDGDTLQLHVRSLRQIITELRAANCRVILFSPAPDDPGSRYDMNSKHEQYMVAVKKMAEEEKVLYVDVFHPVLRAVQEAKSADSSFGYTTDGIHPRAAGHVMIARAILAGLGFADAELPSLDSPLLKKVKERNETYVRRWRETQVPALVADTLDAPETHQKLAELDERIAQLEAEIQSLRELN